MEAVRQFHKVVNGVITIELPVDFSAAEVEVIILPKQTAINGNAQESDEVQRARQSFLSIDTSDFTPEQMRTFVQSCKRVMTYKPGDPRLFGLYEGLIEIADDFNELPEEYIDLFYADNLFPKTTDEIAQSI